MIFKLYFFIISCATVRENTIGSMKNAASHGADMVEFDVQVNHNQKIGKAYALTKNRVTRVVIAASRGVCDLPT